MVIKSGRKERRVAVTWHFGIFPIHFKFMKRIALERLLHGMKYKRRKHLRQYEGLFRSDLEKTTIFQAATVLYMISSLIT